MTLEQIEAKRNEADLAIEECASGLEDADWLKKKLSSLGVVIAVEGELPELPTCAFGDYPLQQVLDKCKITQERMLKNGYKQTVPLMEDKDETNRSTG